MEINMEALKQITEINERLASENREKFMQGQHEHGGNFFAKPTVRNIREEVLDLVNYSHVLEQHKAKIFMDLTNLIHEIDTVSRAECKRKLANIAQDVHSLWPSRNF